MSADLQFDPMTHRYTLNGRILPSVTQVLKGMGLICYSMIAQEVLQQASRRGTAVHQALQYLDDGELDEATVAPELAGYVEAARRFYLESGFQVAHNEFRSYHPIYLYGGTMDKTGIFPDGSLAVLDWKTGLVVPGHGIQLAAYTHLLKNPLVYRRLAIKINDDSTYRVHEFPTSEAGRDWQVFLAALACFNWQLQHETGKA